MLNYKELYFKCGLEIHQQLNIKKLFCDCSTKLEEKDLQLTIRRKIRPVAGELGEIDIAAKFEYSKDLTFIYHCYKNEYCLVELDEEPIHFINEEALNTALALALLLKLKIPDVLCVMRKMVIDGSAISSFQRTVQVGLESENSFIETSKGKVKISSLCLEEDSAKIEKQEKDSIKYSLSRLGIPLIELRTEPDIKDPGHAKEVAEQIGLILRSFPAIKRGLGTIRQDVNVSIANGSRIEIKGFQDLRTMPKIIENEVIRQLSLIEEGKKVNEEVRRANQDLTTTYLRPMPGVARMYPESDHPLIKVTKEMLTKIKLPELLTEKVEKIRKQGIEQELAREIIRKEIDIESYIKKYKNINPEFIARTLIEIPKEIKTRFDISYEFKDKDFNLVLDYLSKGLIVKKAVLELLLDIAQRKTIDINKYKIISEEELEKEIKEIIEENKELSTNAIMGIVMEKYRGKVEGKKIIEVIKKFKK